MLHCCFTFQKICLILSRSKRRANFPILRKISFVYAVLMRLPNLHTAPKRHLIKTRRLLKRSFRLPRRKWAQKSEQVTGLYLKYAVC